MQQADRAWRRGSRHFDELQALDLARAARLLATVKKRVDSLPAEKKKGIFGMHDTLGPATANLWNFKIIMIRCANELRSTPTSWLKIATDKTTLRALAVRTTLLRYFKLYC